MKMIVWFSWKLTSLVDKDSVQFIKRYENSHSPNLSKNIRKCHTISIPSHLHVLRSQFDWGNTATPENQPENWLNGKFCSKKNYFGLRIAFMWLIMMNQLSKTYVEIWFRWFLSSVTLNGNAFRWNRLCIDCTRFTILHAFDVVVNDISFLSSFELNTHLFDIYWSGFPFLVFQSCINPRLTSDILFFVRLLQAGSERDIDKICEI